MSKNYSVRSVRETRPWFGTKRFYIPMVYDPISEGHVPLTDVNEMTTVWGFESEDEAWKVIDAKMMQDDQDEYYPGGFKSDREDFHTDG